MMKRICKILKDLKNTLSPMTWKERIGYLWEYYKHVFFLTAIAIILVVSLISIAVAPDPCFEGVCANIQLSEEGTAHMTSQWLDVMGGNPKKDVANLSFFLFQDVGASQLPGYTLSMRIVPMVYAQALDYMLLDQQALDYYLTQSVFQDLHISLTDEQISQMEDCLFYYEKEDGTKFPIALDISETAFVKAHATTPDKVYIAFPGNTKNVELCDDFLDHLLNWKPE